MDAKHGKEGAARVTATGHGVLAEAVEFASWNPWLPRHMADAATRETRVPAKGCLFHPGPEFPRPLPAVVIVQGLGGPKPRREIAYGRFLARNGYLALTTDSFASRGLGRNQICRALRVSTAMLLADAFAGLDWLSRHPAAARRRIGVIGFSFGGMVSVLTAYRRMAELYLPHGPAFAAHVSYYGSSIPRLEDPAATGAPVLIMLGNKDGNVSIPRTEQIAQDLRRGGSPVRLEVFDAYHQWDGPYEKLYRTGFHLRDCHVRISNDGTIRDEKSGRRIEGYWSQLLFLLRHSVVSGYLMQRDPAILKRSNAQLLSFLGRELGAGAPRRQARS
jgi:dienelactone hydrolase